MVLPAGCAGSKAGTAYIYGICAVVDGCYPNLFVFGWGQQFDLSYFFHLLNILDIIWCGLVYEIVQPVGKQQVGVTSPGHLYAFGWVVIAIIVLGHGDGFAFAQITYIFVVEGEWTVFAVSGDVKLAAFAAYNEVYAGFGRLGEDAQFGYLGDILTAHFG